MQMIEPYQGRPDINRLVAAMRGEPTDRVPNFEILIEDQQRRESAGPTGGQHLGRGWRSGQGQRGGRRRPTHVRGGLSRTVRDHRSGRDRAGKPHGPLGHRLPRLQAALRPPGDAFRQHRHPGGRWLAGSSHSIVNYIPHENFAAMINAIHKYGAY